MNNNCLFSILLSRFQMKQELCSAKKKNMYMYSISRKIATYKHIHIEALGRHECTSTCIKALCQRVICNQEKNMKLVAIFR